MSVWSFFMSVELAMKRGTKTVTAAVAAALLAMQAAAAADITFVGGITQAKDTPLTNTLEKFAALAEEKTHGAVKFEVKTDSVLGGEREMTEAMQLGTIDFGMISTAPLSNFAPAIGVCDLPFIFQNRKHAWAVLAGPIGDELFSGLPDQGLVGLSWIDNGFRSVYAKDREIRKPADMKGLKIRVMESDIYVKTFAALTAQPVPMSSSEVYTALQQGAIDAGENSIISYNTLKYYEVAPVYSLTNHTYSVMPIIFAKASFDKLTPEQQKALKEAAVEAAKWHIDQGEADDERFMNKIKTERKEVKVIPVDDLTPFREAVAGVYREYAPKFRKNLIEDVLNTKY